MWCPGAASNAWGPTLFWWKWRWTPAGNREKSAGSSETVANKGFSEFFPKKGLQNQFLHGIMP
jgi:hypothetical protein